MNQISVKALIIRGNKVLLLKPKNILGSLNGWDGPGGHIKAEEAMLDSLTREVIEETGLKIKQAYPVRLLNLPQTKTDYLIFLCTASSGKVVLSDEHTAYKWVSFADFRGMFGGFLTTDLTNIQKMADKLLNS